MGFHTALDKEVTSAGFVDRFAVARNVQPRETLHGFVRGEILNRQVVQRGAGPDAAQDFARRGADLDQADLSVQFGPGLLFE